MFLYTLLVSSLFPLLVSAQSPSPTCPIGYFCASADASTQFTYGPASSTASPQAQPTPTSDAVQVDDSDPRIVYSPSILWKTATVGGCPICFGNPNNSQAFNFTWHEGIRTDPGDEPLTAMFNFTGTSVSVYAILPAMQLTSNTEWLTSVSFLIDGATTSSGNWSWNPPIFNPPSWNTSVNWSQQKIFDGAQMPLGEHSLQMLGSPRGWSMFLLDYVEYRTGNELPTQTQSFAVAPLSSSLNHGDISNGTQTTSTVGSNTKSTSTSTQLSNDASRKSVHILSLHSMLWVFVYGLGTMLFAKKRQ